MFKSIRQVLAEQFQNKELMLRMAVFDIKGMYQIHYLGTLWQFLNPAIQVAIYWTVFGLGMRGGQPVGDVPFFLWLLMGLIPWFFISPSLTQSSNSIYQKVSLVSKMNFPVSLLPTVKLISNSFQFIILMVILQIILLLYGYKPSVYILQLPYFIVALYAFLFSFAILSSTIATLIRDYQMLLQSMIRMILYLSPVLWDPNGDRVPEYLSNILKLNPFYYIIEGFRSSMLGTSWFFEEPIYMLYFWSLTFALLYLGTKVHVKLRNNFVDYL
ncbi:ABC transporter permease [Gracilibacillus dipsosauri]|uniref:ABC transporter permease n=1 Tax=Gracilibacillus dipsosauri TaxID=178340 RepID=UPI002409E065